MASQIETLAVLKLLGDVYPSYKLTSSAIEVYIQLLADIAPQTLGLAAMQHVSCSAFFPSVAELRSAAYKLIQAAHPSLNEYEAWGEVRAEIRRVGYCGAPHFTNPITTQVVEQLGWQELCLSENRVADRAHFIQAYQQLLAIKQSPALCLPGAGESATGLNSGDRPRLEGEEKG